MSLGAIEFRPALISALRARDGLAGVDVQANWMGPDSEPEAITLVDDRTGGGARVHLIAAHTSTPQHFDDDTVIPFTIRSPFAGDTPADGGDAEDRALALAWELVDTIRQDPTLSRSVAWAPSDPGIDIEVVTQPFESGWAAFAYGTIPIHKLIQ